MPALWEGSISFGLVYVPVSLHTAEVASEKIEFRMLDKRDEAPIKYKRVNQNTGEEVAWADIVKGYEYEKGSYVIMDDEDFKAAYAETSKTVTIEDFVNREDISPAYFEKPYFLVPEKGGNKGYALLREMLKQTRKAAVAKVALRNKEYLCTIVNEGKALLLIVLRYHHELKSADDVKIPDESLKDLKITERELDMAKKLVEQMTSDWKPERYKDDYNEKIHEIVEFKLKKPNAKPKTGHVPKIPKSNVIDMMELLKKSVEDKNRKKTGTSRR